MSKAQNLLKQKILKPPKCLLAGFIQLQFNTIGTKNRSKIIYSQNDEMSKLRRNQSKNTIGHGKILVTKRPTFTINALQEIIGVSFIKESERCVIAAAR